MNSFAPLLRIIARYAIGILVAKGFIPTELINAISADPMAVGAVELGVAAGSAFVVERYYMLAKRRGWSL